MTGTQLSSEGLDGRRRRLLFRAWHRGIREMDFVMGRFADSHLAAFTDAELDAFEFLLTVPDQEMFAYVTGVEAAPENLDTPMFRRLRAYHLSNEKTV